MTDPTTIEAATSFLDSFFTIFDTGSRSTLLSFYAPTARMTYENATSTGPADICTFLVEAPKKIAHKRTKTVVEPLGGDDGGVLVLVTGILEFGGGNAETKFSSAFLLEKRQEGSGGDEAQRFVIANQITSVSIDGTEELDLDDG